MTWQAGGKLITGCNALCMKPKINATDFVRNIFTLATGTSIAQVIPVLIAPVLTRLFSPDDFGLLALFVSTTALLSVMVTGKYELAIVLPEKEEDARKLVRLALLITAACSLLLLLLVVVLHGTLLSVFFKKEHTGQWLYLLPLAAGATGVFEILRYYSIRKKAYRLLSRSLIIKSAAGAVLQIAAGIAGMQAPGLIGGNILALFSGNVSISRLFRAKEGGGKKVFSLAALRSVAARYRNFPKYTIPSALLNTASVQLPVYVLGAFFSNTLVGFYALSQRVLSMPMNLVGAAVGQVYFQKAAECKEDTAQIKTLTWNLYRGLLWTGVFPIAALVIWGDVLFAWVFGKEWIIAGRYAQRLSIWFLFVFISSPLSNLFFIQEKQKQSLVLQLIIFISRAAVLFLCVWLHYDALRTVTCFGIVGALLFFCFIFYLLVTAGISGLKVLGYTFAVVSGSIGVFYLIDRLLLLWT